jgi:hypothetical protein
VLAFTDAPKKAKRKRKEGEGKEQRWEHWEKLLMDVNFRRPSTTAGFFLKIQATFGRRQKNVPRFERTPLKKY